MLNVITGRDENMGALIQNPDVAKVCFTGSVNASSSFPGSGDYKLVQDVVARKIADQCTAAPAAAGGEAKS